MQINLLGYFAPFWYLGFDPMFMSIDAHCVLVTHTPLLDSGTSKQFFIQSQLMKQSLLQIVLMKASLVQMVLVPPLAAPH